MLHGNAEREEDATEKGCIHPRMNLNITISLLAFSMWHDKIDELCKLSKCFREEYFSHFRTRQ